MRVKCIGEFLAHGGLSMNGKQQKQQQQQRHHQYLPNGLASGASELRMDALSSTQLSAIYGGFANGIHDSISVYVPSFILQLDQQDVGKDTAVTFTHSFIQKNIVTATGQTLFWNGSSSCEQDRHSLLPSGERSALWL